MIKIEVDINKDIQEFINEMTNQPNFDKVNPELKKQFDVILMHCVMFGVSTGIKASTKTLSELGIKIIDHHENLIKNGKKEKNN